MSVLLLAPAMVNAGSAELNEAVKQYYAGNPVQALGLLEPVALDGDVEAQYLMGNILYSLSKSERFKNSGDPIKWYQMAADQGVADASYAIGVIYHNNWSESRDRLQAAFAMTHFQKAADAGYRKASVPLNKLKAKTGMSVKTASKLVSKAGKVMIVKAVPVKVEEKKKSLALVKKPEKKVEVIAKSEPEEVVTKVAEPTVETKKSEPEDVAQAKVEPAKVEPAKVEPAMEAEIVIEEPLKSESLASLVSGDNNAEVSLAELAGECSNYTQVGYNYYAESIKGASFTGIATITKSTKSNASTRQVGLVNDKYGIVVVITLKNVPKQVVAGLGIGDEMDLNATIVHSQIIGSSCAIDLSYLLTES